MSASIPRVDIAAGALALDAVDVRVGGPLPFVAARRYRSGLPANQQPGPMGPGWALGWDLWLDRAPDVWALRGGPFDGARFAPVAPGREAVQDGTGLRVQHHADGAVVVFASARRQYVYGGGGASPLVSVRDVAGGALTVRRAGAHVAEVTGPLGHVLRYDVSGGRLRGLALVVDGGAEALAAFEYALSGELTAATDAAGRTTAYRYDGGLLVEVTAPDGRRSLAEHDADGRCLAVWTHGAPVAFHLSYDPLRQQTLALDAAGGQTLYTHAAGRLVMMREDPAACLTTYLSDDLGRFAGLTHDGELAAVERVDEERRLSVVAPGAALFAEIGPGGLARTVESASDAWALGRDERLALSAFGPDDGERWRFGRDRLGRVTSVESPAGRRWRLGWDGGLSVEDALGVRGRERHDTRGRPTEHTDRLGRRTAWSYTGAHLAAVSIESGEPRTRYRVEALADAAGRTVALEDGEGRRVRHAYDVVGLRSVERDGARVAVRVDGLGRPVEAGAPGHETVRIGYDAAGRLARVARGERVVTYTHADGETTVADGGRTRVYGAADEPLAWSGDTRHTALFGATGELLSFERGDDLLAARYDAWGALAGLFALRAGAVVDVELARDPDGLLTAVHAADPAAGAGVELVRLDRDAAGRPATVTADGVHLTLELDAADRLVGIRGDAQTDLGWDLLDRPTALDGAAITGSARRELAYVEARAAVEAPDPDDDEGPEPGTVGGGDNGGGPGAGAPVPRAERPAFRLDLVATRGGAALVLVVASVDVVLWSRAERRAASDEHPRAAVAAALSAEAALAEPAWRIDALDAWAPPGRDLGLDQTTIPTSRELGAAAATLDTSALDPAYHDAVWDPAPGAVPGHDHDAIRDAHDAVTGSHREGTLRPRPWRERAAAPLLSAALGRLDLSLTSGRLDPDDLAAFVLVRPPFVALPQRVAQSASS